MKIKSWILLSYLIVVFLPISGIASLYYYIYVYDRSHDFAEYSKLTNKMERIETSLNNPDLYKIQSRKNYHFLSKLTGKSTQITLYRADGLTLYSSLNQEQTFRFSWSDTEELFRHLNDFKINERTFTIKKPVFQKGQLVGIYEITLLRTERIESYQNRSKIMLIGSCLIFILIYGAVIFFVHRKFSKPLKKLQQQMTAFAEGKQIEPILHDRKDEIGDVITHFENMQQQIKASQQQLIIEQQEKQFLIASLTHDLKTPLTAIRAYTESLHDNKTLSDEEKEEYFSIVFAKMNHLKQMLDELSIYTSLQSMKKPLELVEVDGIEFFEMLLSGYDELCEQKKILFSKELNILDRTYSLEPKQMIRIIDNMMANAVRFTKPNQMIGLSVICANCSLPNWIFPSLRDKLEQWRVDGTAIIVQNEGEYVPTENQAEVFKPFFQLDDARTKQHAQNSGLGLTIAKILIEKQYGKIALWSAENEGTIVACWLPERME